MAVKQGKRTTITMSDILAARLAVWQARLGESRSALVREAVTAWLRSVEAQQATEGMEGATVA